MEYVIFYSIIAIIVAGFLFERILDYLNLKSWSGDLPDELRGIYSEEKYRKSQEYEKEKSSFSLYADSFNILLILTFLFFNGFAWLDGTVRQFSYQPVSICLLFFAVLGFAADILQLPFSLYGTFILEEKYGFNRTTVRTYIADKIKGYLLAILIGGGLLALFTWFYFSAGKFFWIYAWVVFTAFSLAMTMFYTTLIVPVFNKLSTLEAGALRNAIEAYARKVNFNLKNIFVMDGSKRTTKANAYFSGLGGKKTVVLYDTLIKEHTVDEIVAILAHEVGHYKKKHSLKMMAISIIQTGFLLFLLSLCINRPVFSFALGAEAPSFHVGLIAFGILFSPVSTLLGIGVNMLSRKHEFEADAYAGQTNDGNILGNALKKLSVNHLSNLKPHPAYVFVYYSHPPLLQRLNKLKAEV